MIAWHVVFTQRGREHKAAAALRNIAFVTVFCPGHRLRYTNRGRIVERILPLLSGVVFAEWQSDDPYLWHDIKDTYNVRGILGGDKPTPVRGKTFEEWLETSDPDGCVPAATHRLTSIRRQYWEGSKVVISYRGLREVVGEVVKIRDAIFCADVKYTMLGREHLLKNCPLRALSAVEIESPAGAKFFPLLSRAPR